MTSFQKLSLASVKGYKSHINPKSRIVAIVAMTL